MKQTSRRAKRMERAHKRNKGGATLNLTALMDIFTILVFFLMFNQSDVRIEGSEEIRLPDSVAQNAPNENLVVVVTKEVIMVQGRPIMTVADAAATQEETLAPLLTELQYMAARTTLDPDLEAAGEGRPINIVGDKDTPYQLLQKVMKTASKATFGNISLAVNQLTGGTP
ncbi:ExbD/TolR family protein [Parathalassolituus penaei]|uniref:Biopolymer transporter ExbD n=1 Tax=Parathalassolituus penaei TaxID=2997323 RepID=A0A9X3EEB5_9GAMM|nr:biopolymer transporter ExbD [Parathalassolituus penaei]MCY0965610.1 biopolymer transporter ExbD [Parathalassolituus penaei]